MHSPLINDELATDFASWVDQILLKYRAVKVVAHNFNIYTHEKEFAIQLIGASTFDEVEEDWACDEVFSSGEDLFYLPHSLVSADWKKGLAAAKTLIKSYLKRGKEARRLQAGRAVAVGFVDGNLHVVYNKTKSEES